MAYLATDVANPDFVGAQNPDAALFVEFYWHEPVDKWASEEESNRLGKNTLVKRKEMLVDPVTGKSKPTGKNLKLAYVRIMRPGDQTSIIETSVREEHKQRWPERWLYWQMQEGLIDGGENVPGWRIEEWPHLTEKQELLRDLKHARFHTVDMVAGASDAQVQRLGIGGAGLREQARVDLRNRMGKEFGDKLAAKDKEVADMKARLEALEKLISKGK